MHNPVHKPAQYYKHVNSQDASGVRRDFPEKRERSRSICPSGWDPDARRICPPTARGGGFSCPSRLLLLHHLVLHPRARLSPSLRAYQNLSPRVLLYTTSLSLSLLLARLLFLSPPSVVLPGFPLLRHLHVVTPPALPPSSASSSCRYRYHYHCPRHYHRRRRGVDGASSSTFSWPSPPAKSTWWLPHHLDDPASLSTNDQRLSLLRGV